MVEARPPRPVVGELTQSLTSTTDEMSDRRGAMKRLVDQERRVRARRL